MACRPAALEAAVGDPGLAARSAHGFDGASERGVAGGVVIGADVEDRQLAVEQARYYAADRMRFVEHDIGVAVAEAVDLLGERIVIGIEPGRAAAVDLGGVGLRSRAI